MPREIPKKRIQELSEKWLNGTITEVEKKEYDSWYSSFKDHQVDDLTEDDLAKTQARLYKSIKKREGIVNISLKDLLLKNRLVLTALSAASVILFILSSIYLQKAFWDDREVTKEPIYSSILPGRSQATLSLDNGIAFNLDSLKDGQVFQEAGIRIEKSKEGELIYSVLSSQKSKRGKILKNTVSTPRGGQYRIELPDGSKVWLNAASSLKFPAIFNEENRIVELEGEAYFEVTEDKNRPFKVITENEEVQVLGTHFNVNSYQDESISSVTLLEGKVKVSVASNESKLLIPGQQSIVSNGIMQVLPVNVQEAVAWKNGEFMFNNETIKSVMQKIARWYDVEVYFSPELENKSIWGTISKYENIDKVLNIIKLTDETIHFRVEGRRIYVMK